MRGRREGGGREKKRGMTRDEVAGASEIRTDSAGRDGGGKRAKKKEMDV